MTRATLIRALNGCDGVVSSLATGLSPFREIRLLSQADKDKDGQEAAIRASSLDWVIVRPAMLTNDPARGSVRAVTDLAHAAR